MDKKLTICIDFDGVIHSCEHGWQDGEIYGNVVPGFFDWAYEAQKFFKLTIYSSRSATEKGRAKMYEWIGAQWRAWDSTKAITIDFAHEKPIAFLTIDDRCIKFNGDWSAFELDPRNLRHFKAWNN